MAVPVVNYSPETDWVFGAAAQGYFTCPGQSRTSIVQLDGAYSLARQWYINASGNVYFGTNTSWMLRFRAGFRNYPDYYYENHDAYRYNSRRYLIMLQPHYCITPDLLVGLNLQYINETTDYNHIHYLGYGPILQYDTRNTTFYPSRGMLLKATGIYCSSLLPQGEAYAMPYGGSKEGVALVMLDFRHFVTIYKELVFSYQLVSEWAIGNNVPFQMLPTLGGQDLLRGIRRCEWRGNAMMALQAELRIPLWNFLKATVFCGVGDVYDYHNWEWNVPKVGYGVGIRASINKAKVNIRFDVARSNMNNSWKADGWSYYLTATEAF